MKLFFYALLFKNIYFFKKSKIIPVSNICKIKSNYSTVSKKENGMLFYSGGSNLFKKDIYGEFIETLDSNNIQVYDVPYKTKIDKKIIKKLKNSHKTINALGHSSGCTTLLNQCDSKNIDNIFLLDPVNTNLKKDKKYNVSSYKSISFIDASKSYKITFDPFGFPFVPFFRLLPESFNNNGNCLIYNKQFKNYGHSDILNAPLSDFMHFTRISVGNKDRTKKTKNKYFNIISNYINKIIMLNMSK